MRKNTPTPWAQAEGAPTIMAGPTGNRFVIAFIDGDSADPRDYDQRVADAAFIVSACNSHDGLVAALRGLRDYPTGKYNSLPSFDSAVTAASAVLAKMGVA